MALNDSLLMKTMRNLNYLFQKVSSFSVTCPLKHGRKAWHFGYLNSIKKQEIKNILNFSDQNALFCPRDTKEDEIVNSHSKFFCFSPLKE